MVWRENNVTMVCRRLRNFYLDLRYGEILYGSVPTQYAHLGAHSTENSSYTTLELLFKTGIRVDDVLVDVGCGKGRVINWWLNRGLTNRIVGIELDEKIADKTRTRLRRYRNVEIITGNAITHIPEDATIFYLYNPFDAATMLRFKKHLQSLAQNKKKHFRLIYNNCRYLDVFVGDPKCTVTTGNSLHPFAIIEISDL